MLERPGGEGRLNIFDFLMDNIYLVIIVLGFVMSLLGKSGGQKKGQSQSGMPTFGGGGSDMRPNVPQPGQFDQQHLEQQRLEQQRMEQQRADQQRQQALQRQREEAQARQLRLEQDEERRVMEAARQQELARRATEARQSFNAITDLPKKKVSHSARPAQRLFDPNAVNHNDLRKAVVWSEVLGPPRAKKPYNR